MRKLFKAAADASPCIVFIDEIDAVGSKRNPMERQVGSLTWNWERIQVCVVASPSHVNVLQSMRQTINELLVQLDGFSDQDVIVIAGSDQVGKQTCECLE